MNLFDEYVIKEINIDDSRFPNNLKKIKDCPNKLYVMGDETLLNKPSIAIVGTRASSSFGNSVSLDWARDLAKRDIIIISGMANGIDINAHEGALEYGNTIAVLAGRINTRDS